MNKYRVEQLKIIPELRDLTHEERLKECGLTTVETRQLRDQIKVFKILNGYENIEKYFFSLKKDSRTTGHGVTLVKDQHRLDIITYSFSHGTINEWKNCLQIV